MAHYAENEEFVRDLAEAASHESERLAHDPDAIRLITDTPLRGSRAAMLSLIDMLARRSLPGLATVVIGIMVTAAFFVMEMFTAAAIGRAALWLAMSLGALGMSAWRLAQFRRGLAYGGRPFTWRAHYTCTLGFLSFTLGCGAILLTPAGLAPSAALLIGGLLGLTVLGLALSHLAHRTSAISAALPALLLTFPAIALHAPPAGTAAAAQFFIFLAGFALFCMATAGIAWHRHHQLVSRAIAAHPRHEMPDIRARRKQASKAYNPFRIRLENSTVPVAGEIPRHNK